MKLSRRELLGYGAAGAVGLASAPLALGQSSDLRPTFRFGRGRRPKNVIFMVADGMAASVPTMADHLRQLRDGKHTFWAECLKKPGFVRAWQDTRSLSSLVTDSAAASSTWGSGRWVWNGALNSFPDGTELKTLTKIMSEHGVRCGLVTTTTITHATPAGFAVSVPSRDLEPIIATKYLNAGVDVLMGGGDRFFSPERRADKTDVYAAFAKAGYNVVKSRDDVLGLRSPKILGVFSDSHLPYTVDRDNDPAIAKKVPTLAEMTKAAIANLSGGKQGFLLQVEGGKVDHGAHANDLAALLYDQLAFDDAVRAAIEFAQKDGETMVVVTSDHATGGVALNGAGNEYFDSTAGLLSVGGMKASFEKLSPLLKDAGPSTVQDVVQDRLGLKLSADDAATIVAIMKGDTPFKPSIFYRGTTQSLAVILGNYSKVTFTSGNHTSDVVMVMAYGPGSETIPGLVQNTSFFDLILATKGLAYANPTMTKEEAMKHIKDGDNAIPEELMAYFEPDHDECADHGSSRLR
ncbi:MAG: alkaline phosphatase [Fimbriimonadaceae bacterium]|nr:alkaline phosphatase [Fimbriimonadaceae bacterium]